MDCFFYPTGNWINRRVLEIYVGSNDAAFPGASRLETIDGRKYRHASIDLDDEKKQSMLWYLIQQLNFRCMNQGKVSGIDNKLVRNPPQ